MSVALSIDQRAAIRAVGEHQYVAIFGAAGTGKSRVRDVISASGCSVVLGPTGMSIASVRSGQTISRFLGGTGSAAQLSANFAGSVALESTIVIDEVSMVSTDDFVGLDYGIRGVVGRDVPFGGLRVVLLGDVYQLEPPDGLGYFFETATFAEMERRGLRVVRLVTQHRQTAGPGVDEDADVFRTILGDARRGRFGTTGANLLAYVGCRPAPDGVTRVVARRADAARHNGVQLAKLPGPEFVCGNGTILRVGARVVFTQNYYASGTAGPLVAPNGAVGRVVGLPSKRSDAARVLVAVDDGCTVPVNARRYDGQVSHPLGHAWALTIHKTQGQTLKHGVVVDGTNISEAGQAYVAISRVGRLDDLWVTNLLPEDFEIGRRPSWVAFVEKYGLQ